MPASTYIHHIANYIHLYIFMQIFRLVFNTRVVIPLWLPINTTVLELLLFPTNNLIQVCFSVELTGCQSGDGKYISIHIANS